MATVPSRANPIRGRFPKAMPSQVLGSVRPDTPKAQAQSEGKAMEKAAPQSSGEKLRSVKAAMSF